VTDRRAQTLLALMEPIERFTLGRVWHELTDDELLFEPFDGMWSVRRRDECTSAMPFGDGDVVVDFDATVRPPEPMTTIAWLLWHIGSLPGRLVETEVFGGERPYSSGWTSPYLEHHEIFTSADRAVTVLRDGWASLRAAIESATDDQLERPVRRYTYAGTRTGDLLDPGPPGPEHPAVFLVAGALNEVSHHGTQVCALRDVYVMQRH
jgi:hypothetical protein